MLDSSGKLEFKEVAVKTVKRSLLNLDDVFVFDIGSEVFVWVGKGASPDEKKKAMSFGQQYLKDFNRPAWLPMCRILDGGENEVFQSSFDKE